MKTVTIGVSSIEETNQRVEAAFRGEFQGEFISFLTPQDLWAVLGGKRWELLNAMIGAGPISIREAARRVGRDVKAVHSDVHTLLNAGVLDRDEDGKIVFPYDAMHVDFTVTKAA